MFSLTSRYFKQPLYQVSLPSGQQVVVVQFPGARRPALSGYHRREEGQRLDLLAAFYLKDATLFWRVCDANGALSPHALQAHSLIGIPR